MPKMTNFGQICSKTVSRAIFGSQYEVENGIQPENCACMELTTRRSCHRRDYRKIQGKSRQTLDESSTKVSVQKPHDRGYA